MTILQIGIGRDGGTEEDFGHLSIDFEKVSLVAGAVFVEGSVFGVTQSDDIVDMIRGFDGVLEHNVIGVNSATFQIPAVFCTQLFWLHAVIARSTGNTDSLDISGVSMENDIARTNIQ